MVDDGVMLARPEAPAAPPRFFLRVTRVKSPSPTSTPGCSPTSATPQPGSGRPSPPTSTTRPTALRTAALVPLAASTGAVAEVAGAGAPAEAPASLDDAGAGAAVLAGVAVAVAALSGPESPNALPVSSPAGAVSKAA